MYRLAAVAALCTLAPTQAAAHLVGVEFGAFYAGTLHLIVGIDYISLILATSLLAALQDRAQARWVLAAFPIGLCIGVIVGLLGLVPDGMEQIERPAIAVGLAVAGALGIAAITLPIWILGGLALANAVLIGAANAVALEDAALDAWLYGAGIAVTGTVLITLVLAGASVVATLRSWLRLGTRVACSWLATLGVLMLGLGATGTL